MSANAKDSVLSAQLSKELVRTLKKRKRPSAAAGPDLWDELRKVAEPVSCGWKLVLLLSLAFHHYFALFSVGSLDPCFATKPLTLSGQRVPKINTVRWMTQNMAMAPIA